MKIPVTTPRYVPSLLICAAVAASSLAMPSVAGAADRPDVRGPVASGPRVATASQQPMAAGLIVRTDDGSVSTGLRARAEALTDLTVTRAGRVFDDLRVLTLDHPVPLDEAQRAADALVRRPDVISAEPDLIMTAQTAPPVGRNDPYFNQQLGVWDSRADFQGVISLTGGGFSVKAPSLWRATTGKSSVRVAVIDSGSTTHPDLAGQTVAGYDFLSASEPGGSRDSTPGRDSNPADPGDWRPTANYCTPGADPVVPASLSSWHGTHVAGIVAARANNSIGVAGIASGVRVQPIRALGACGGTTSDIAAAIQWAAGISISGVPTNKTPAKIINLSLGSGAPCSTTFQTAISKARAKGAVVVAATGNDGTPTTFEPIGSPASCAGVISVVSTNEVGASAVYSNWGTNGTEFPGAPNRPASISAPGGERYFAGMSGILSTINSGATGPSTPGYTPYVGTSMASPAVAGGAALMSSLGYSRSQIETALKKAVRAFPHYTGDLSPLEPFNCTTVGCGAGILDLSKVPAPYATPKISGTMKKGKKLAISSKKWTGSPSYAYQWYRNGKKISKATKSTYTLTKADKGKKITVRVYGKKSGFRTLSKLSPSRKVAK